MLQNGMSQHFHDWYITDDETKQKGEGKNPH